ncbi:prephenate dehydratase [Picrophilus oshimae]|uniref:Prephenate dehydratase n=1 Tax=Picrophilus torridus (strain ATCC 700027 / DSM 9790 / JCM 10055 / NBRC 100828 / KAW 2/3) TaxID=1122961 RepID=A0A8G2L7P2_PICTO|nr:prephenate dehydratase [Picrophilus oshimae]SMD31225.1 prephenate dehydratase [Picrophilus oshimae DSM 9789]
MIIGYFGDPGSYTSMAARLMLGGRYVSYRSILDIVNAIERNELDFGVVPIENSIEGQVGQTYDIIYYKDIYINSEYYMKIDHCLIGNSEINKIRFVHSHPQALAQCSNFINKNGFIPVPEYSTSYAIKTISEINNDEHAAIGSEEAANLYNLKIISKSIQNNINNYTRFISISKHMNDHGDKYSIGFSLENRPGSLSRILNIISAFNINMTKIESRPYAKNPFSYIFFIDFEDNGYGNVLIDIIKRETINFKLIGLYRKSGIETGY